MTILAGVSDYLFIWQLPLLLVYVAIWLIGGLFLTRLVLRRLLGLPKSKTSLGRCAQFNILTTGAGLAAMLIVTGLLTVLGVRMQVRALAFVGLAIGVIAMLGLAWAVSLTLIDAPAKTMLRVIGVNTGSLVVLAVVIGVGAFIPARALRRAEVNRLIRENQLKDIHLALQMYSERFSGAEAPSLKALVDMRLLPNSALHYPGRPGAPVDYVYIPSPGLLGDASSRKVRVCDRHGKRRAVLFADGEVEWVGQAEFDELQRLSENAGLAERMAAGQ